MEIYFYREQDFNLFNSMPFQKLMQCCKYESCIASLLLLRPQLPGKVSFELLLPLLDDVAECVYRHPLLLLDGSSPSKSPSSYVAYAYHAPPNARGPV